MRGISATSFDEVLRHAESAFDGRGGELGTDAEQLFSTADAIDSSNQLIRALSDPGGRAEVKEATARSLFEGRVGATVLEVLLDVVRRRWSHQEDVLDALEQVGVVALLRQAEAEGALEQVEGELFGLSRLIDDSGDLTGALDDARELPERRAAILRSLLEGRAHRLTADLAIRAAGRRTDRKPARRIEDFARFAAERRRRAFAAVTSAVPLNEVQRSRLATVLAGIYGREIQMNLAVDPDVVGGLRIQVGDDLYDATVLSRLAKARARMAA